MSMTPNLGLTYLVSGQLQPEVTVNNDLNVLDGAIGAMASAFGYDTNGSSGLTFAYFGGAVLENGAPVSVAAGTVTLTASATNYVQRTPGGAVSVNTTGFTAGYIPMAEVVTNASAITTVTDMRPAFIAQGSRIVLEVGAPTGIAVSTATTGGSIAASTTNTYQVSALYPWGESAPSAPVSVTTGSGTATNENTISWTLPTGAIAAKIYGRTSGSELFIAQVAAGTSTYTDTGSVTPSGALPTGSFTLTEAEVNADILSIQGALTAQTTLVFPLRPQKWVISNETAGAYVVDLETSGTTAISVGQGSAEVVYCNGTALELVQVQQAVNATNVNGGTINATTGAFSGQVTGAAPAQFDVSSTLITSAFAQQLTGGFSGFTYVDITGSGTGASVSVIGSTTTNWPITGLTTQLEAEAYGTECQLNSGVANTTTYLPPSAPYEGFGIFFVNNSTYPQIVAVSQSGGFIYAPAFGLGTTNTQITLAPGQSVFLMNRGSPEWDCVHGVWMSGGYSESNQKSVGSTTASGNITITAAEIMAGYFADGATQTAAFTFTTDTATNLLTALTPLVVGSSVRFRFINNDQSTTGYAGTLAVGTGVTLGTALPNPAVPKGGYMDYLFVCTNNTPGSAAFTVTPVAL